MNSLPSNHFLYYNHNLHDPTLVNVYTLLNPQPFKHHTPPSIPTFQSATAQYWASHPPFSHQQQTHHSIPNIYTNNLFNHGLYQQCPDPSPSFTSSLTSNSQPHNLTTQQPTQPLNSTTTTDFLLQQMLQSQQTLNHAISKLASDISTLSKSLTPLTHSQHITQHATHKPSHHYQPQTISTTATVQFSSPPVIIQTNTVKTQKPDSEINVTIFQKNELVVATKFVEPKITKESHELTVVEDDFTHTIDLVSKVDEEEIKLGRDLVTISSNGSDFFEQKVDDVKDVNVSFSATTAPSTETKVVRAVVQTPEQHPRFTVELPALSIHVFDPGEKLTVAVNSAARRHQIQNSRIFTFRDSSVTFVFDPGGTFTVTAGRSSHLCHPFEINKFRSFNFSCDSGIILVFDPGGDKCRFLAPVTVLFPARSAIMNASSGRPWVPWSRKHKVPKGCIEVYDPEGASFVFRLEFPIATMCHYCFKVRRNHTTKWAWCFWLIIGLCVHIGLAVKRKKKPTQQICFQHRNSQNWNTEETYFSWINF